MWKAQGEGLFHVASVLPHATQSLDWDPSLWSFVLFWEPKNNDVPEKSTMAPDQPDNTGDLFGPNPPQPPQPPDPRDVPMATQPIPPTPPMIVGPHERP